MKGAAEFCLDWLIEDGQGHLVTAPSTSPENEFVAPDGVPAQVSWTSVTNWTLRLSLTAGTNALTIEGLNSAGATVSGGSLNLQINYTGLEERPEDRIEW